MNCAIYQSANKKMDPKLLQPDTTALMGGGGRQEKEIEFEQDLPCVFEAGERRSPILSRLAVSRTEEIDIGKVGGPGQDGRRVSGAGWAGGGGGA